MHGGRRAPLNPREDGGVEAELEDVRRLRVACELGVDDLVGAVGLLLEKVGKAVPVAVDKVRLKNDVCHARTDRVFGLSRSGVARDLGDPQSFGPKLGGIASLMLLPFATNQLSRRIVRDCSLDLVACRPQVEGGEMLAS